jgi:hypothetical protein
MPILHLDEWLGRCPNASRDGAIANQQGVDAIASAAPGAGHGACPPMQGLSGWLSMQP